MTFDADEQSQHDAEPIHLFHFESANTDYYLTSNYVDVSHSGDTYTATAGVKMSPVTTGNLNDVPAVRVTIPRDETVVQDMAFDVPERALFLTVTRLHTPTGLSLVWWQGPITHIRVRGEVAEILCPSLLGSTLKTPIPNHYYQAQCNVPLYSTACGILRTAHDQATTVSTVSGNDITVASTGGLPLLAGEIVRDSDGERRSIVAVSGTVLTVNYPFRTLVATDAVTLYAGCKHTLQDCKDTYNNVANFRGHPYIPHFNIWELGLRGGEI